MNLRLIVYAVAALALIGGFLWFAKHEQGIGAAAESAKYERLLEAEKERVANAERSAREISEAKDHDYQAQATELRNRIDSLLARPVPIRLCKPASRSAETGIPETAGESHAATDNGQHDLQASDDLASELVRYAGEAEGYRQQLIALQEWVKAQQAAW